MVVSKYFIFLAAIFLFLFNALTSATVKKPYVVYLGAHSHGSQPSSIHYKRVTDSHCNLLGSFVGGKEKAKSAIFHSYTKHINGFAANLEEEEANGLSKHPGVVSVFSDEREELQTTRSWEFLGLETNYGNIPQQSLWRKAKLGEDTIIGNLDTGVWPESASFNDDGMGPIPSRWKGSCDTEGGVRCNRKLIGARYFKQGYEAQNGPISAGNSTARDFIGHGTHTLSTAGGRFVHGASVFGYGEGTAKGGSPNARVAAYKVCWPLGCYSADVLAAFDQAIDDGVDILSLSIAGPAGSYFSQSISIGSFHAVNKGILVVCSAGNQGPSSGSVRNVVPWIMTVGASTMDREFSSYVRLGNGQKLRGQSLSTELLPSGKSFPLIISSEAKTRNATSAADAIFCRAGSLDPAKVKRKIVACSHPPQDINSTAEKGEVVKQAGGVGMIVMLGEHTEIQAHPHLLPAIDVGPDGNVTIHKYYYSTSSPTAYITKPTTELGLKPAPRMAAFSSQGPNSLTPEILKPDITAPGVNVLAAYTTYGGPTYNLTSDPRRVPFNVLSGTSMSCPHVAGIAGLLKTMHPKWSPAAIRSAIMTTAQTEDNTGRQMRNSSLLKATPFSYGAGHVRPDLAADPGLVYDLTIQDYLNFLCNAGYNHTQIAKFTNQTHKCGPNSNLLDLNYPSITVPNLRGQVTISRTVKHVVSHSSTYTAQVLAPPGIHASVQPMSLKFEKINEEKTFKLTLQAKEGGVTGEYAFGKLMWSDGIHNVSSPIVVRAVKV